MECRVPTHAYVCSVANRKRLHTSTCMLIALLGPLRLRNLTLNGVGMYLRRIIIGKMAFIINSEKWANTDVDTGF